MVDNFIIKTDKSFLTNYTFEKLDLLNECIEYIDPLLIVNPKIYIYAKEATQHRSIGFFSNVSIGYKYSGQMAKSQPLSKPLEKLLKIINKSFDSDFNGILINKYMDGNDYIGPHSDNETSLGKNGVIAISYGAVRKFRIRDIKTKEIIADIPTNHGEILHMGGEFQKEFTHEIPIEKKVKECRYSFTFRKHLE